MPDRIEVLEKLPDGVTLHDASDGTILHANEAFCEMLGYSKAELQGLSFDDIHVDEPPYTTERAREYIRQAATEGSQTFEWVDETKEGDPLPVEVNLRHTTLDDEDRIIAVVRDIRERKQRERELERKNQQLEEFTSVVSHDLRNPLNVIQGHVELLREDCESDQVEAIDRAANRMDELLEDLLTLAREGDDVGELEPVDLESIAERCWQNVETNSASLNVEMSGTVKADRSQFQQLLENLFRNAVEHGPSSVTITIGGLEYGDGFYVKDDGPGIARDEREKVFEVGYSTVDGGTGFGLSIVRQIVEGHDWEMRLADADSGGAKFEFRNVQREQ